MVKLPPIRGSASRPAIYAALVVSALTVPAFAATETLRRLNERYPGYDYKEAVLNPTNLRDKADDWETSLIEQFRKGGEAELTGIHGEGLQRDHQRDRKRSQE